MAMAANTELFTKIDALELGANNRAWREAMKAAPYKIFAEREKYTVASWRETEGEDLQLRRAKLLARVLDNIEIKIHPFDEIAGRPTPGVIGCATSFDVCGDYIPAIWSDSDEIDATLDARVSLAPEDKDILREAARAFGKTAAPAMTYRAWENIAGSWARDAEAAKLKDPTLDSAIYGQTTSALLWEKTLSVGLRAFVSEAKEKLDGYVGSEGADARKIYFWQSAIVSLEAVIRHAHRYANLAEAQGREEMAETLRRVPEFPARNLREALQSMVICNVGKMLEHPMQNNSHWARADQYLYEYFMNDLKNGVPLEELTSMLADVIGRWGTQTFVSSESQKESHQINFGINNIIVGGKDENNLDQSNELSYLILHIVGLLKLSSPTVCLRWNNDTPDWLMNKAIRTNIATRGGIPLFENDEIVVESYVRDGIPRGEAVNWHSLGCVYPALPTRAEHYGAEGIAAFNLAGLMHLTLHNGIDINGKQTGLQTGDPKNFSGFGELYAAFLAQHKFVSHRVFRLGAIARGVQPDYIRLPLLSVLSLEASMELGQDLLFPHPDYSMFGVSDRGIIDVADSLTAVKKLVFDDRALSFGELLAALDGNFTGREGERVRQLCLNAPKYGNGDAEVDALAKRVSDDSALIIRSYDNSPFRPLMIAREGLAWHYYGGLGVGALPNGRYALEPLDDGAASPQRGADVNGPTAVIRSACNACFSDVSYASVLNQKFSASILSGEDSIEKLAAYTSAYMGSGGSHIQYNIVDSEDLRSAKQKPAEHTDLIVRIGGFSAYFVQLSGAIQDDVILRSEFTL